MRLLMEKSILSAQGMCFIFQPTFRMVRLLKKIVALLTFFALAARIICKNS
ncbi:hypothetical protein [Oscillospiraceae bacterium]|nr:hypothetical protein [Oscillospiraceae bacterium]